MLGEAMEETSGVALEAMTAMGTALELVTAWGEVWVEVSGKESGQATEAVREATSGPR
jgi:hypothetical protein